MNQHRLMLLNYVVCLAFLVCCAPFGARGTEPSRTRPTPGKQHPGNIFLHGEKVIIDLPHKGSWTLADYDGRRIRTFGNTSRAVVRKLPVGFYRLSREGDINTVSLAVLERLKSPTPLSSPIGIDVAMAWLYPEEQMAAAANLCSLAGANWVRDRVNWTQMEIEPGRFSESNRHDASATAQTQAGLQVLQNLVNAAKWANPVQRRFPPDLRDPYHFFAAMTSRWKGSVLAFEPWNEADVERFGGHTGAEIASYQKAAYLGLKAGNPQIIACLTPWVMNNRKQLGDFHENRAWPYFDTYNLHHYFSFEDLPRVYRDHRAVSAGRPIWVTESGVLLEWVGDTNAKELSDADLRIQAESVAKVFAISLHEGSVATFYFVLPHYSEEEILWGLLRPDLSPRPAYVALAAVGRLLADARPVGKMESCDDSVRAYLFAARPDGKDRHVMVAWTTNQTATLRFPRPPEKMFDLLGRPLRSKKSIELSGAPVFAVFSNPDAARLPIIPAPAPAPYLSGTPCDVVLQAIWPEEKVNLDESAYVISADSEEKIPVFVYNFGPQTRIGTLSIEAPSGWGADIESAVQVDSMQRVELSLTLAPPDSDDKANHKNAVPLRIHGDFGTAGESILSIRVLRSPPRSETPGIVETGR